MGWPMMTSFSIFFRWSYWMSRLWLTWVWYHTGCLSGSHVHKSPGTSRYRILLSSLNHCLIKVRIGLAFSFITCNWLICPLIWFLGGFWGWLSSSSPNISTTANRNLALLWCHRIASWEASSLLISLAVSRESDPDALMNWKGAKYGYN